MNARRCALWTVTVTVRRLRRAFSEIVYLGYRLICLLLSRRNPRSRAKAMRSAVKKIFLQFQWLPAAPALCWQRIFLRQPCLFSPRANELVLNKRQMRR